MPDYLAMSLLHMENELARYGVLKMGSFLLGTKDPLYEAIGTHNETHLETLL